MPTSNVLVALRIVTLLSLSAQPAYDVCDGQNIIKTYFESTK